MNGWNDQIAVIVAAAQGVLLLALIVWLTVLTGKLRKLKTAYRKIVGDSGVDRMDEVLHTFHERMGSLSDRQQSQEQRLNQHERRLHALKGRIGVHRFNAFADSGSDLSFSVAIVNDEKDGVVITGIHGREHTFLYAKPIDKGQSAYMLTPEEKLAINQAMQKE